MRRVRLIALAAVLLAASCDGSPPPGDLVEAEPTATRRFWNASNEQAREISGSLAASAEAGGAEGAIVLAFANGVTLRAHPEQTLPASTPVGGATFLTLADLLGAPPEADVRLYIVDEERVAPSATRGGLCAGLRTRSLAIAEFIDESDAWVLRIASFHGELTLQDDPGLCYAFDFVQP